MINAKRCTKCKEIKPLTKFGKNKEMKDGLAVYCKSCVSEIQKNRRSNNQPVIPPTKQCRDCLETKSNTEFHRSKQVKDGLATYCKKCCAIKTLNRKNGAK